VRRAAWAAAFIYLAALTALLNRGADLDRQLRDAPHPLYFLPRAELVLPLLLGCEAAAADLLWIRGLGYFFDEMASRGRMRFLEPLATLIVELDPRFEKAYIWGGTVLIYNGLPITRSWVEASNRVLGRAVRTLQTEGYWPAGEATWRIPFMLGFNHFHELRDRARGAYYFRMASAFPGAPPLLRTLPATLLMREGLETEALAVAEDNLVVEMLKGRLELSRDSRERQQLLWRIRHILDRLGRSRAPVERKLEAEERALEALAGRYREEAPFLPFGQFLLVAGPPEGDTIVALEGASV
jgi:hypothetical protein